MNKKTIKRINAGISIYYGVGCLLAGFGGLVAIFVLLYKTLTGTSELSWGFLIFLVIVTAVMGALGYSILRVAFEEVEK